MPLRLAKTPSKVARASSRYSIEAAAQFEYRLQWTDQGVPAIAHEASQVIELTGWRKQ
jgi:hypothetical protein